MGEKPTLVGIATTVWLPHTTVCEDMAPSNAKEDMRQLVRPSVRPTVPVASVYSFLFHFFTSDLTHL